MMMSEYMLRPRDTKVVWSSSTSSPSEMNLVKVASCGGRRKSAATAARPALPFGSLAAPALNMQLRVHDREALVAGRQAG